MMRQVDLNEIRRKLRRAIASLEAAERQTMHAQKRLLELRSAAFKYHGGPEILVEPLKTELSKHYETTHKCWREFPTYPLRQLRRFLGEVTE